MPFITHHAISQHNHTAYSLFPKLPNDIQLQPVGIPSAVGWPLLPHRSPFAKRESKPTPQFLRRLFFPRLNKLSASAQENHGETRENSCVIGDGSCTSRPCSSLRIFGGHHLRPTIKRDKNCGMETLLGAESTSSPMKPRDHAATIGFALHRHNPRLSH